MIQGYGTMGSFRCFEIEDDLKWLYVEAIADWVREI